MVFKLVSSMTQLFDVSRIKLRGITKTISAQSNLVHYECVVQSSQFMDCEDVNGRQLSPFALSSQQSACSMSWMHALEKLWLQQHQDQVLYHSGGFSSQSTSGNANLYSVTLCKVLSQCCKTASSSACHNELLSLHYSDASVFAF